MAEGDELCQGGAVSDGLHLGGVTSEGSRSEQDWEMESVRRGGMIKEM